MDEHLLSKDAMSQPAAALLDQLRAKTALIRGVGLGYCGLPLSLTLVEAGVNVLGFDIFPENPKAIVEGRTYFRQFSSEPIAAVSRQGTFAATLDMGLLSEPDAILICVPTPLAKHLEPYLLYVTQTAEAIAVQLRPGQLVVLETTAYPGTTLEVLKPIMEKTGLVCGQDVLPAFSLEREDPGNQTHTTSTIPKVVGADDETSNALACAVHENYAGRTVPVSTAATSEWVKITENIFRPVNIPLFDELKIIYQPTGINVWEAIDTAKTKPFGFMPFYQVPSIGGQCISINPLYLTWQAEEFEVSTKFLELAGQINSGPADCVVHSIVQALGARFKKGLNGWPIYLIVLAYKKNIDDIRYSSSLRLTEKLGSSGSYVDYLDPHVPTVSETREHASLAGRKSILWNFQEIGSYDAVFIATDHDTVACRGLSTTAKLVVDTRNGSANAGAYLSRVATA
jgi:UDP-N-acetyl-D-glucosamine dehydrogenase